MKKVEEYIADCGNLKLTHGDVAVNFKNGIGDGNYYVTIVDTENGDEVDSSNLAWEGMVEGEWNVEFYDCGKGHPIAHISGLNVVYSEIQKVGDRYIATGNMVIAQLRK